MIDQFELGDIKLNVQVEDCRDAIQKAADVLIETGNITQNCVEEMLILISKQSFSCCHQILISV